MRKPESREPLNTALEPFLDTLALFDEARLGVWDADGLTVTQLRLLSLLAQNQGVGNSVLADGLGLTRPSVSALLERLQRGEFIRRDIDLADRRGITIWLEERGRDAISPHREEMIAAASRYLGVLDDHELESLTRILGKLSSAERSRPD
ncbi:hypothetical protein AYO38_04555 [bacterium SCGC AG-212-C10]|nr:hypothetical protein AYO38_04555 [bacterium SCGC AG-212-C10]